MQIGVEGIENLFMTTTLKTNKNLNMTCSKKKTFPFFFTWELVK
jgi:hypothetical protein